MYLTYDEAFLAFLQGLHILWELRDFDSMILPPNSLSPSMNHGYNNKTVFCLCKKTTIPLCNICCYGIRRLNELPTYCFLCKVFPLINYLPNIFAYFKSVLIDIQIFQQ